MLTADIIKRVREIQLRTGRDVSDVLAGEYSSVFKGSGLEFDEVRPYLPGDDVRTIDWNVTARAGAPHVKRYVEERQLTMMLMADISASQDYGSGSRSKREAAAELCALLAFSAIRNDDKVGLVLFHGEVEKYVPPRKGMRHALRVVREVIAAGTESVRSDDTRRWWQRFMQWRNRSPLRRARQRTDLRAALDFFASVSKRRSVCFVVSDFLHNDDDAQGAAFERALSMANRRHDVIAVLLTDPAELRLPAAGMVTLMDAESGAARVVDTNARAFRAHLEAEAQKRIADLERRLGRAGIDFIHVNIAEPVIDPLIRFFKMRERRARR
jgi:uncharacterized protein (DUF58 family)